MLTAEAQVIQSMFHIPNKQGLDVPFKLNESQEAYDVQRTKRDIIAKARQKGFSSLGIAYQTVDCLGKEGTRAVLISHEAKSTQRLLDKARFYIQYLEGPSANLGRRSRNEFYFPKTESTYYIGTAGAKSFGRGDTITHLHISEYAWWESDALQKVAGLFQAVPDTGTIRIESTGNGRNNDFYYMTKHAEKLGYNIFFRAWHHDNEYRKDPKPDWEPEGFEHYFIDMQLKYNLDEHQLYWYWMKLLEFRLDLSTMQQEYPSCLEECFKATGGVIFKDLGALPNEYWQWKLEDGKRIELHTSHPRRNFHYVIGGDASGGTGNDDAAAQIFCIETLEQVYEQADNDIDPVEFGHLLCRLGYRYNEAYIVAEANQHGIATHSILKKKYLKQKLYKRKIPMKQGEILYGYITNENTKHALIGAIYECINLGISIYGKETIEELLSFEEDPETGRLGADKDNLVIALGLVCIGLLKWHRFHIYEPLVFDRQRETYEDVNMAYTTFEDIMDSIKNRNKPSLGSLTTQVQDGKSLSFYNN